MAEEDKNEWVALWRILVGIKILPEKKMNKKTTDKQTDMQS
jgi:hypothetical protein